MRSHRPTSAPATRRRAGVNDPHVDTFDHDGKRIGPPPRAEPIPERLRQQLVPFKDEVRVQKRGLDKSSHAAPETLYVVQTSVDKPILAEYSIPAGTQIRLRRTALDEVAHAANEVPSPPPRRSSVAQHVRWSRTPKRGAPLSPAMSTTERSRTAQLFTPKLSTGPHFAAMSVDAPRPTLDQLASSMDLQSYPAASVDTKDRKRARRVVMSFELEAPIEEMLAGKPPTEAWVPPTSGAYVRVEKALSDRLGAFEADGDHFISPASSEMKGKISRFSFPSWRSDRQHQDAKSPQDRLYSLDSDMMISPHTDGFPDITEHEPYSRRSRPTTAGDATSRRPKSGTVRDPLSPSVIYKFLAQQAAAGAQKRNEKKSSPRRSLSNAPDAVGSHTANPQHDATYRSQRPTIAVYSGSSPPKLTQHTAIPTTTTSTAYPGDAVPSSTHFGNPQPPVHRVGIFRTVMYSPQSRHLKVPVHAVMDAAKLHAAVAPDSNTALEASQTNNGWGEPYTTLREQAGNPRELSDTLRNTRTSPAIDRTPLHTVPFAVTMPKEEVNQIRVAFGAAAIQAGEPILSVLPRNHYPNMLGYAAAKEFASQDVVPRNHHPNMLSYAAAKEFASQDDVQAPSADEAAEDYTYNVSTTTDYKIAAIHANTEHQVLSRVRPKSAQHRGIATLSPRATARPTSAHMNARFSVGRPSSSSAKASSAHSPTKVNDSTAISAAVDVVVVSPVKPQIRPQTAKARSKFKELSDLATMDQAALIVQDMNKFEAVTRDVEIPWQKREADDSDAIRPQNSVEIAPWIDPQD